MLAKIAATASAAVSRRRLLFGLAAASTVAAMPTAVAAVSNPAEDPELIRLGDMLPGLAAEIVDADRICTTIIDEWGGRWPDAPKAIRGGGSSHIERDLTDHAVYWIDRHGMDRVSHIHRSADIRLQVDYWSKSVRRARTDKSRQRAIEQRDYWQGLIDAATAYEAECDRIRTASGYTAARQRQDAALDAMADHVLQILRLEPHTMAGVIIQAQAIEAADRAGLSRLTIVTAEIKAGRSYGQFLASSLLRVAEGAAA